MKKDLSQVIIASKIIPKVWNKEKVKEVYEERMVEIDNEIKELEVKINLLKNRKNYYIKIYFEFLKGLK